MKRNGSIVALLAGGVLLAGAQGAFADRHQERCDPGSRIVRSDWHAVRDRSYEVRQERGVDVRNARRGHDGYWGAQPLGYVRAAEAARFAHRDGR